MLRSLNSGVSGIQAFQQQMDVIGNNIANVNTTGFKAARVNFADSFSDTLRSSSSAAGTSSGTPAVQIGTGVLISDIRNQFTQGALARTGVVSDLAIAGDGFFVLRDPVAGTEFVSRAGDFRVDADGYLTNNTGLHLQGYVDGTKTTVGDLKVDDTWRPSGLDPAATYTSFSINPAGEIMVRLSDGSEYVRGQILLQRFTDPQMLMKEGVNLFSGNGAAGPLGGTTSPTPAPPSTNGLGRIESGALELSNVDLAKEFANMITTQRGFQANARVITTSDQMLQELVNLTR